MRRQNGLVVALTAGAGLLLGACGGGMSEQGRLTVAVTDAPVDEAAAVVVSFTGVSVKPANGPALDYQFCFTGEAIIAQTTPCASPVMRQIDLLSLQGGASEKLLDGVVLPAGAYNWLRLDVRAEGDAADSYLEDLRGGFHALAIPSGAQTGLKLVGGFDVPLDGHADFTIDFDLRKSVHRPASGTQTYRLRPALRMVDTAASGAIAGVVGAALVQDGSCTGGNAVYVFAGEDAALQDVRGDAGDPVAGAAVALDEDSGDYRYYAAYLAPGAYTLAFTCQGVDDQPDQNDAIDFSAGANITVEAGVTSVLDFAH